MLTGSTQPSEEAAVAPDAESPTDAAGSTLPLQSFLQSCYTKLQAVTEGEVADYIPDLSKVDPSLFGLALTTVDGHTHEIGESRDEFTIQSVSKAFVYALAVEAYGHEEVFRSIGVEPSGDPFNSIRLGADNRPFNPMVNAGAIACTGLLFAKEPGNGFERIRTILDEFAGRSLGFSDAVYRSEAETGDRNRSIAWLLKSNGILTGDVEAALDAYFRQCSVLVSARDLSIMGATLANNGVNPVTGRQVVSPLTAARTLSVMVSSGMYDFSGEWIYKVGLPAKSGVGGGIVAALPAQIGLGSFSPRLDSVGNSVRGLMVCEEISSHFGLHVLERQGDVSSNIAAEYGIAEVRSRLDRRPVDQRIVERYGHTARVLALTGALNFVACDYVSRRLESYTDRDVQIIDFRGVSGMSMAAAKVLVGIVSKLAGEGVRIVFSGLAEDSAPGRTFNRFKPDDLNASIRSFTTLNDAITWAEDQIIYLHGGFGSIQDEVPLAEQPLLAGLDAAQMSALDGIMELIEVRGGTRIIESGAESDSVFFLTKGMVGIVLASGVRVAMFDAGTCFGELALIAPDEVRSADVVSDSVCRCYKLRLDALRRLAASQPGLLEIMLKNLALLLARRLRQANARIDAVAK